MSILHGGPNTQLRKTMQHIGEFGVDMRLFDPWAHFKKDDCDVFHIFAANVGTYHLAHEIHVLGIPMVVSPIFFRVQSPAIINSFLRATRVAQHLTKSIWTDAGFTAEICNWSRAVLPNSKAEGELISRSLGIPQSKITVIPNGVDERFYHAEPSLFKKTYGLENVILNVGHIGHTRKNVLSLIKALGQIDHPSVIIGRIISGQYGDACVAEAKKHKQVLMIDGLDNNSEMLASAYAAADTFVLPSLFETPGIAALEAGLAGAKIVITPHGGTEEYFGKMAEYVDPHSVESIRAGVIKALQVKKNDGLREHIRAGFLWQHVARKTAAAYRQISGND
ncbi:MAG: glycosyltransferase [Bacteroidetes bacterium]|nr:glycosyltransferase [Bacteroidota bacterium]MCW5895264.1 glycosyltransferase [Bacteroidota bacterium]